MTPKQLKLLLYIAEILSYATSYSNILATSDNEEKELNSLIQEVKNEGHLTH